MSSEHIYRRGFSPFSVNMVFLALVLIGFSMIPLLNIQFQPSRTDSSISVYCNWPEASALVIEQEVTSKLEAMLSTLRGLRSVESRSIRGGCRVALYFDEHTDLEKARFEISTMIRRAYPDFPDGVGYPAIDRSISGGNQNRVLSYKLSSTANPWFIRQYAEDNIKPRLAHLKGVGDVTVSGVEPYEWEITFDADKIRIYDITTDEIVSAIRNYLHSDIIGTGISRDPRNGLLRRMQVSLQLDKQEPVDWGGIPVKKNEGRIVYLNEFATVRYKQQQPYRYFRINGVNTISLNVYAEEGSNDLRVAEQVKKSVNELMPGLPSGYSILLSHDTTEYIYDELRHIGLRMLISAVTLLLFVLLISRQWRYLMLISISLFANLIIALICYNLLQLQIHMYSLAALTVSFGILIDNSIVMIEHYRVNRNRNVFMAIFAASLTTIASLSLVFLLEENQKINLLDFAWVMMANITVSLAIALWFIPSMMDKIPLPVKKNRTFYRRKRRVIRFTRFYGGFILFGKRWKWVFIPLLVLGFGLPLHWLPEKLEQPEDGQSHWISLYNHTLGSDWFNYSIREDAEIYLGGSLRLFSEYVFDRNFYSDPERTRLYIHGAMPEGTTVHQLNDVIRNMENYLSLFDEISLFETSVFSYNNGRIIVYFKPEHEHSSFPHRLKRTIVTKAIGLGGVDWQVYGVGRGYSNASGSPGGGQRIRLTGYNYNLLYEWAEHAQTALLRDRRVRNPQITGTAGWRWTNVHEYYLEFDSQRLALGGLPMEGFYDFIGGQVYRDEVIRLINKDGITPVTLVSNNSETFNTWWLRNSPIQIGENISRLPAMGNIEMRNIGNEIHKTDQVYQLYITYSVVGPHSLAQNVRDQHIDALNDVLPVGFKAGSHQWTGWYSGDEKQYYLILLIILIIYFVCAILLESLLQPLAIIMMIPVSFIGVFLTFYLFDLNFDQGGFAALVLLCGLAVNSGLYIINDFKNFRKENRHSDNLRMYLKAYNHKIIPVFLTLVSTMLGLLPFLWGGQNEIFWFAFSAGTIGGLSFSIIGIMMYFPMFLRLQTIKE